MDPFQQLPAELVLSILHHTGDFLGFDSLLQVSPHIRAVFQSNSFQITEDLLASCPTTAHELHHFFHVTALIHSPSFNPVNFEDLATAISTACSSTSFHNNTARLMISIAAQIQHLACACLSIAWVNFQTAHRAILPEEWSRSCEPFSWIEVFYVHRALWLLRIYSDLWNLVCVEKKIPVPDPHPPVCTNTSRKWSWSPSEADKIITLAIFHLPPVNSFELHCVADLLRHLGAPSLRDAETPTVGSLEDHFKPLPPPLFASLHVPSINITLEHATWPTPPIPEETDLNCYWRRSPENTSGAPRQAGSYIAEQLNLSFRPGLYPTGLDDMRPFYRLGMFIWDSWRMYQMGYLRMSPRWREEMIQAPDGSYIRPPVMARRVFQKRWCSLVGKKPGGSKRIQELMEKTELF
ncbi:hypothetical protein N7475_003695 [Penicillium sp. IBT 31633x]|nr:hypothetical protein N7475_003695 [Penicillium sp. IBT 31633x]